jgi:hypothetical protein
MRNLVAKHSPQFNKSAVFTNRKKARKNGYQKHKEREVNDELPRNHN